MVVHQTLLPNLEQVTGKPAGQLLKWIGNKQRYAAEIVRLFPKNFGTYFEPFLGSGAVLAHLAPKRGVGSDTFEPLVGIWKTLKENPERLKLWYSDRFYSSKKLGKKEAYEQIRASYNACPNASDLLFLCRACYGGVVRFRKADGYMSTPCGIHDPITPESFSKRVDEWHGRMRGADFLRCDYVNVFEMAKEGDVIYCDPPYSHSQAILYGAQKFSFNDLIKKISIAKNRGVQVVLSIDGTKKSGEIFCNLPVPVGLFVREIFIDCGRSMLKRFQMQGKSLEKENVQDRLLLTY